MNEKDNHEYEIIDYTQGDHKEAREIEFEETEERSVKDKLMQFVNNDPLYPYVEKDYEIISDDILALDQSKLYSTKDVVSILDKYDYLYDPEKGESYINENRIRWWLNEKEDDNLIFYFNLDKPGRSWVWNIESIIKAKMVAILRYCKNYQQKMIKAYATGVQFNTPKINDENVVDLIERGHLDRINNFDLLKEVMLASIQHMNKEREVLFEQYNKMNDRYEQLKRELEEYRRLVSTKEEVSEMSKEHEQHIEERDRIIMLRLDIRDKLRKEAIKQWDIENSGFIKRVFAKESDKETFIQEYMDKHFDDRFEEKFKEYKQFKKRKYNQSEDTDNI